MSKGQLERKIEITYRWWRSGGVKHIKPSHVPALEESAMDRIKDQMAQGCVSGELNDNICMNNRDGAGIEYSGYWEVKQS